MKLTAPACVGNVYFAIGTPHYRVIAEAMAQAHLFPMAAHLHPERELRIHKGAAPGWTTELWDIRPPTIAVHIPGEVREIRMQGTVTRRLSPRPDPEPFNPPSSDSEPPIGRPIPIPPVPYVPQ